MPGIYGIVDAAVTPPRLESWSSMFQYGRFLPDYVCNDEVFSRGVLGRIDLNAYPSEPQPVTSSDGTVKVVLHGELSAPAGLVANANACSARIVAEEFARRRAAGTIDEFFAQVHGRFNIAVWDEAESRLHLFTDFYGSSPLYYTLCGGQFLFSSDLLALTQNPAVSREFDKQGVAQFFTYGQYVGDRTSFESIRVPAPRSHLIFDVATGTLTKRQYASDFTHSAVLSTQSESDQADAIADAFYESVQRDSLNTPNLGVSLSGGLDARSILACVQTDSPQDIVSIAMGIPGCGDHKLAAQLAKRFGTTHFNYALNTDFLREYPRHFEEMVRLTDGQYLSTAIVIPTLDYYRSKNVKVLLRGHAGELFHLTKAYAFSLKESELAQLNSRKAVFDWAAGHLKSYMLDGVDKPLLKGVSQSQFNEMGAAGLDDMFSACADGAEPAAILWQLFLDMRVHREIALSMKKFGSRIEVRLPFLDKTMHERLFAAPRSMCMGETIEKRILEKFRPDFLKVKNVNTGTYIGASPLQQEVAHFIQRVLAKLGAPGYQPYERMGLWLRRELKDYVGQLVLSERNLDSGLFNPDTLRWIIDDHNNGANHTYLIVALMVFAQLQKEL
ncbi:MAG: hypothetical protein IKW80_03765 [Thermoguttaceae bacterium]|nr:hypothetical protein [Thermoguttaceae bacterium]